MTKPLTTSQAAALALIVSSGGVFTETLRTKSLKINGNVINALRWARMLAMEMRPEGNVYTVTDSGRAMLA